MTELEIHRTLCFALLGLALFTFLLLSFLVAPYGRHFRRGWGVSLPSRWGWIVMESPAVLAFVVLFLLGSHRAETMPLLLLGMWQLHYVHRTYVYPFRLRSRGKRMPLVVVLAGLSFNLLNAYLNARWISHLGSYPRSWAADPRFAGGTLLFLPGLAINLLSDTILLRLRGARDTGYSIPRGGLFRWVSSPNYLGEIIEWFGWALATWSLPGLAFAIYTVANLGPRATANHRWYRQEFPDYPAERRALLPYLL